jgi:predicted nucleic acid-binding protein
VPHFLDTNVLLYSISPAPAEAAKRERALELLDNDDGALSVQVLQEFYVQSTRTTRPGRLTHDLAVDLMDVGGASLSRR